MRTGYEDGASELYQFARANGRIETGEAVDGMTSTLQLD